MRSAVARSFGLIGVGWLVLGCDLVALATAPWIETVVDNRSSKAFVVDSEDNMGHHFIAIPPHSVTAVDGVDEMNGAAIKLLLLSADCNSGEAIPGYFSEGGVVLIDEAGSFSFHAGRMGRTEPTELVSGKSSCQEAAASLR